MSIKTTVFIILGVVTSVLSTNVSQCPGTDDVAGNLNDLVTIGNCKKGPCRLRKNTVIAVTFKLKPNRDIEKLTNNVNANIVGVPFPFIGVDQTDACGNIYNSDNITKVGCPLKSGNEYIFKNQIEVLQIYPRIKLVVHWGLTAQDGKDIICFEVPARITN